MTALALGAVHFLIELWCAALVLFVGWLLIGEAVRSVRSWLRGRHDVKHVRGLLESVGDVDRSVEIQRCDLAMWELEHDWPEWSQ